VVPSPDGRLSIVAWPDRALDLTGHDPRSPYAERFWLHELGPTTLLLHRFLVAGLDPNPRGYSIDVRQTAWLLGVREGTAHNSIIGRSLQRLIQFRLGEAPADGVLAVRRRIPTLSNRQVARLPAPLQAEHAVHQARASQARQAPKPPGPPPSC